MAVGGTSLGSWARSTTRRRQPPSGGGRGDEARVWGRIDTPRAATAKLVRKLAAKYERLTFCYEAGPTGYGLHRQLTRLGQTCSVVAPSLIPNKPGGRG